MKNGHHDLAAMTLSILTKKKKKSVGYVVNVFYLSEYTKALNACHLQNISLLLFITENKKVQSKNQ